MFTEKKSVRESPLKREVQAVKSILQGGSSSMRDHSQQYESHHSKDTHNQNHQQQHHHHHHHHARDDPAKHKKRNIFSEVFKKPSNAKELIGRSTKQRATTNVHDKFEMECIVILNVSFIFIKLPVFDKLNKIRTCNFRI